MTKKANQTRAPRSLTPKQDVFARLVGGGMNQTRAYTKAYKDGVEPPSQTQYNTYRNEAYRIAKLPHVRAQIILHAEDSAMPDTGEPVGDSVGGEGCRRENGASHFPKDILDKVIDYHVGVMGDPRATRAEKSKSGDSLLKALKDLRAMGGSVQAEERSIEEVEEELHQRLHSLFFRAVIRASAAIPIPAGNVPTAEECEAWSAWLLGERYAGDRSHWHTFALPDGTEFDAPFDPTAWKAEGEVKLVEAAMVGDTNDEAPSVMAGPAAP